MGPTLVAWFYGYLPPPAIASFCLAPHLTKALLRGHPLSNASPSPYGQMGLRATLRTLSSEGPRGQCAGRSRITEAPDGNPRLVLCLAAKQSVAQSYVRPSGLTSVTPQPI